MRENRSWAQQKERRISNYFRQEKHKREKNKYLGSIQIRDSKHKREREREDNFTAYKKYRFAAAALTRLQLQIISITVSDYSFNNCISYS